MNYLNDDGQVWTYGTNNSWGQLGIGYGPALDRPLRILGDINNWDVLRLASNAILRRDGTVWCWGSSGGGGGRLGVNDGNTRSSPVSVVGNHSFVWVQGNYNITTFLKANNGSVWCTGSNYYGSCGDNSNTNRISPVSVVGGHSFIQVSLGTIHNVARKSDGTIWTWGDSTYGAIGDNTVSNRSSPTSVVGAHSFIYVLGGSYVSAALKADGSAWCWGGNVSNYGQMGDNSNINRSSPVSVVGGHNFIEICVNAGNQQTTFVGRKANGTVWAWGDNTYGTCGDNTRTNRSSPVSVVGAHSFISVIGQGNGSSAGCFFALKADGTMWSWGNNDYSILGDGSPVLSGTAGPHRSSPVSVVGTEFSEFMTSTDFNAFVHASALKSDGTIWGWGRCYYGSFYFGHDQNLTEGFNNYPKKVIGGHKFVDLSTDLGYPGCENAAGLKSDGTIWTWGYGQTGQLGDGTGNAGSWATIARSSPVSVIGNHSFKAVTFTGYGSTGGFRALKGDGSVWAWGAGTYGQLGNNGNTHRSSPVSVVGAHSFYKVFPSRQDAYHTMAIKSDGSAWCWGTNSVNSAGACGDNTATDRSSPVSVVGAHSFTKLVSVGLGCGGLKTDGTVWMWGGNLSGNLGDNSNTNKSSPVSVVGNHIFVDLFDNMGCYIGIKSDGTLWGWGANDYGKIGDNTTTYRSSPVSVVGNHSFVKFDGAYGYKSNGSIWTWGQNAMGALGDNTTTLRSSPVSVVGNHSFVEVAYAGTGYYRYTMARKSDGTVWHWGYLNGGLSFTGSWPLSLASPTRVIGITNQYWNDRVIIANSNTGSFELGGD